MTAPEWTILKLLDWTTDYFTEHGVPSPRLDAELLLSEILKLKRIDLYLNFDKPVAAPDLARFKTLIQRRGQREPLQHILGHADFFGRRFSVTPEVLIPRPETEQLVAKALEWVDAHPNATRVLDFGTGSGCIAITLALERPNLRVTAEDVSEAALAVARKNAEMLGAAIILRHPRSEFQILAGTQSSGVTSGSPPALYSHCGDDKFDLIISNPPYIPSDEIAALQPEVSQFEPHLALDGCKDGLAFYRRLLQDAPALLKPGGELAVEIGLGQRAAIADIASATGCWQTAKCHTDLSGTERILFFGHKD